MYIRQTKNDSKDSFIIPQIMRFGQFSSTQLAHEDIIALRQLSRFRVNLVDSCSDAKRRAIALLDQIFPEYESLFADSFGVTSKQLLLNSPTPGDMLNISSRKLADFLSKASRGRFGEDKAKQIKLAARGSFGITFAKDAFALQLRQLIEQIQFLESQIADLDLHISALLEQTGSYITSIPSIGNTLGAIILSEIGDINRFDAPNKLVAFAGLDVTISQSGEFSSTRNRISKRGSPYLRRAIWLAATHAAFHDPIMSKYYRGLRDRGKHHLTAIGTVSRKLCNMIFVILKEDRPYQATPPKGL